MAVEAHFCSGKAHLAPQDLMTSSESSLPSAESSQIINSIAQNQLHQIEQYILQQYQGLKLNTEERRKRDFATITYHLETKFSETLIQKDRRIARAKNRTAQLELILRRAETEHQQWRNLALVKEAQAIHLNNTLQQLLQHHHAENEIDGDDDAESCCDVGGNRVIGVCRGCGERDACVVLLPCRHLCCCVVCELRIDSCLVCKCLKQNAVQVLRL